MYNPQKFHGSLTGTGQDIFVNIGVEPKFVKVINKTQINIYDFTEGTTVKTHYDDTNKAVVSIGNLISVNERGFTIPASENAANDEIVYFAIG